MSRAKAKLFFQIINPRWRHSAIYPLHSDAEWPYPEQPKRGAWTPGAWVEADKKSPIRLVSDLCKHWPDITHLSDKSLVFVAEYTGVVGEEEGMIKVRRARLVRLATDAELAALKVFRKGLHRTAVGASVVLDQAIVLASGTARVRACGGFVEARGHAQVEASEGAQVIVRDNASVRAYGECQIRAYDQAQVLDARCGAQVIAKDQSHVKASDRAQVIAGGEVYVIAKGRNQVLLTDQAHVHADGGQIHFMMRSHGLVQGRSQTFAENRTVVQSFGQAQVVATGGADVRALEGSRVEADQDVYVEAQARSRVVVRGNAKVVAKGRSRVEAHGQSTVEIPSMYGTTETPLLSGKAVLIDRRKGGLELRVSEEEHARMQELWAAEREKGSIPTVAPSVPKRAEKPRAVPSPVPSQEAA